MPTTMVRASVPQWAAPTAVQCTTTPRIHYMASRAGECGDVTETAEGTAGPPVCTHPQCLGLPGGEGGGASSLASEFSYGTSGQGLQVTTADSLVGPVWQSTLDPNRLAVPSTELSNVEFHCGRAEDLVPALVSKLASQKLVAILDPPRAGLRE